MANFSKIFSIPGQNADAIYTATASNIEHFLSKVPMGTFEIDRDPTEKKVSFKSSMASGTVTASEGSLRVDITLSFLASAFKGKIDEGVTKWLTKTFKT